MQQLWKTIIAVTITAIVVGGGVYFWQQNINFSSTRPTSVIFNTPSTTTPTTDSIKFPVVAYGRPGILNNTEEGRVEKKKLEEKLINPYTDFFNENGGGVVALYIKVPQNVGEPYNVLGIFCGSGYSCGGTEEFSFGKREQDYGYWQPPCDMDGCHFSEAFKKKYPQIKE